MIRKGRQEWKAHWSGAFVFDVVSSLWLELHWESPNRRAEDCPPCRRLFQLLRNGMNDMGCAENYDVIVAGLGAMGSAAACRLAADGRRVLGLDRFQPPHGMGSSHGQTRIIREAYFEHPLYVPLVQRAYELWAELEEASGEKLLLQTGGLMIGPRHGPIFSGAERSAREHGLEHRIFSAAEVRKRYPALHPEDGMMAVWERRAGILFPERAIQTYLDLAARNGATLKFNEPVLRWEAEGRGVRVKTEKGTYRADRLLLAAGAWLGSLCPELNLPLSIE